MGLPSSFLPTTFEAHLRVRNLPFSSLSILPDHFSMASALPFSMLAYLRSVV